MYTHEIIFTLRLDPRTREELDKLSTLWRCSRAEALRRLIKGTHAHLFDAVPTCADGGRCFVPQMHAKKSVV